MLPVQVEIFSPKPGQCLCPRSLGTAASLPGNALSMIHPPKKKENRTKGDFSPSLGCCIFFSQVSNFFFFFPEEPCLGLP